MRRFNRFAVLGTVLALSSTLGAQTLPFSDDFNRADGPVGNGWNYYGAVPSIAGGQLVTQGQSKTAGGVARTLPVTLPVSFSFDIKTDAPADGGWFLSLNATSPAIFASSQIKLTQYCGSCAIMRDTASASTSVGPSTGWVNFSSAYSHVSGVIGADFSANITIRYPNGQTVTANIPPVASPTVGDTGTYLLFGNSNATAGPHTFDNLVIAPPCQLNPGSYTAEVSGKATSGPLGAGPFASGGRWTFDGSGNMVVTDTTNYNSAVADRSYSGSYTMDNATCRATVSFTTGDAAGTQATVYPASSGSTATFVVRTPSSIVVSGSLSQ